MDSERTKPLAALFAIAFIGVLLELYFFNYNFFYDLGLGSTFFETRAHSLSSRLLFQSPLYLRLLVMVICGVMIFLSKPKMKIKEDPSTKTMLIIKTIGTGIIYLLASALYNALGNTRPVFFLHVAVSILSIMYFTLCLSDINKIFNSNILGDRFLKDSKKFDQTKELMEHENSINIKTEDGYINIVNPFRASQVLGTPGSGKTYSFLIEALIQSIEKGYCILLYDYKFPSLSNIAYNALQQHYTNYNVRPKFCVINFDDLTRSNRCNPLQPKFLLDSTDATAAAKALMYGLYPKWAQKQGDFFPESSINFVGACIWALKKINKGKFCTLPHLIQFLSLEYKPMFQILLGVDDSYINNTIAPFISAYKQDATDQLEGQIGTTRIAVTRLTSPYVYWVMNPDPDDEISLQINDPNSPTILCLSNNPDKEDVYGPILSLYNTRIFRLINKPKMVKTAVFLDELPTLSFPPNSLDKLIATARSNKVAVWLGYQDFSQLIRDFGRDIANAIIGTVGNTFSGMVNFETADKLTKKFGRIKIKKESHTLGKDSTSVNISTEQTEIIPASEISSLPQGVFVGQVADDRGYEIDQKVFYSKILIDQKIRASYETGEIPAFQNFKRPIEETINENFEKIKQEIFDLAEAYSSVIDNNDAISQISDN